MRNHSYILALALTTALLWGPVAASVRFNDSADSFLRSNSDLPTFPNTYMGWFKLINDRNSRSAFFAHGGGAIYYVGTNTDGTTLEVYNNQNGSSLSLNTWYHIAIVNASGSGAARTVYLNGTVDINATADQPTSDLYVANDNNTDWCDCEFAGIKIYQAALSQAEIRAEMRYYAPVRRKDNYGFWPMLDSATGSKDFSGFLRHLSGAGTPATGGTNPNIAWGREQD